MTLATTARTFIAARRISSLIHRLQRNYVGREVVETMPNGNEVTGVITEMCWESSLYPDGGWCVKVRDNVTGYESWTSDTVLRLV